MSVDLAGLVNQLRATLGNIEVALGAIADAIVWIGKDTKVQWCNAAFDKLVNRPHILILGVKLSDLLPLVHADQPVPLDSYPDVRLLSNNYEAATHYEFQQGARSLILEISGNCVELTSSDKSAVLVIRDVTQASQAEAERLQAEEIRRQREEQFRTLIGNIPGAVYRGAADEVWTMEFLSDAIADICGYPASDIINNQVHAFIDIVHPDDRPMMRAVIDKAVANHQPYILEYRIIHANSSIRWVYEKGQGIFAEDGRLLWLDGVIFDITDRKQAEQALREAEAATRASELRFRSMVSNTSGVIYRCAYDADWTMEFISNEIATISGYPATDFLANQVRTFASLIHPEDTATVAQIVRQGIEAKQPYAIEYRVVRADGGIRWVYEKGQGIYDEDGLLWLDGAIFDISDRKQAETALRLIVEGTASKTGDEFFCSFVRYLAEVLQVRYGLVTELVETKTRVRTLASWGREASSENCEYNLRGTPCENVFLGKMCYYPENLQTLFPDDLDVVAIGAESYLGIPLTNSSGIILGHLAVIDVKPMAYDSGRELILKIFAARAGAELERKQANEALQRRALIESLLSSISRQFIDQDVDTAINFTLEAIAQFTGAERSCIFEFSDDQSYGYLIYEWYAVGVEPLSNGARGSPVEMFPRFNQILNGNVFQIPCVADLPLDAAERKLFESQSIQSVVVVPMLHSGKVVGFIGTDLVHSSKTWSQEDINLLKLVGELIAIGRARQKAEEALRDAKEAAEAANRAKSIFLANMSHELRTPLNAILGFAQLMQRDAALAPRQQESLATINRSGEHLLNLINDVLEMSKIEAGRTVLNSIPFDLHRLLQTLQDLFQMRVTAKHLALQFEIAPDLPQYVLTDEGKLCQVLINILSNAVKFTQTGKVSLRVSWFTGAASSISDGEEIPTDNQRQTLPQLVGRRQLRSQRTIHFEVEDTGCGIVPEEIDSLFQPFVQTVSSSQAREGTGLGLTISRQFIQLMGGDIHVTSKPGRGSTFCFDVQVTLANPALVPPTPTCRRVLNLAPNQPIYRILVVDDLQESRNLIAQLLNVVGFETRAAENGQEAIAQWQAWQPHLIWMDMRMPLIDGYEATRQIRALEQRTARRQPTVIIALTASAFEEQKTNIISVGCDDLVRKPFREQVIFEKMAEYLGVQYIYEEQDEVGRMKEEQCNPPSSFILYPSSLQIMPTDWIASLHEAALAVDADQILQLIEQIPKIHLPLAKGLTELVRHFSFDEILELTQKVAP